METTWRPRALAGDGGSVLNVNQQDQQAIEELFQYLNRTVAQAGPRDSAADALIQRHVQQGPPGLLYQMAQTLMAQQATINQLRSQLAAYKQQGGAPAGFAPPRGAGYRQAYGQPGYQQPGPYQQQGWQQQGRQGGGFLAGAGQLALGIGGGILGAEVLTSIFDGGGGLFGDDRDQQYDDGFRDGFDAGDNDRDQGDYQGQDGGGYDDTGYDDGGGFDSGGDGGGDIF
jgi:hypothetical protein